MQSTIKRIKKQYDENTVLNNYYYDITIDTDSFGIYKADLYNIINKSVPARLQCYIESMMKYDEKTKQMVQYRNINVEEKIHCVFKTGKKIKIKDEKTGKQIETDKEEYVSVQLPYSTEDKLITYKFKNTSSIENHLLKSTEIFVKSIEEFSDNGSGWTLATIRGFVLNVTTYKPLRGKSYIPLPEYYKNKQCIINVQNKDNECFAYAP